MEVAPGARRWCSTNPCISIIPLPSLGPQERGGGEQVWSLEQRHNLAFYCWCYPALFASTTPATIFSLMDQQLLKCSPILHNFLLCLSEPSMVRTKSNSLFIFYIDSVNKSIKVIQNMNFLQICINFFSINMTLTMSIIVFVLRKCI